MKKERTANILLVEDNSGDIILIKEALLEASFPHELHIATKGEEALDFLYRRPPFEDAPKPDIILLDLNLPGKNGLDVLQDIKNNNELRTIPVIMLTTSSSESDIQSSYSLHANCFITKPIDFDDFNEIVKVIERFWFEIARLPE